MATQLVVNQSYVGVGKVWAKAYGSTGPLIHVGNVSKLDIQQKLTSIKQKDFTKPGGGNRMKLDRLDSVDIAMTWLEIYGANLALAAGGDLTAKASATVASEPVTFKSNSLVRLENPVKSVTTVKKGTTTTYVKDQDYTVSAGGIFIIGPDDGGTIVDGDAGTVSYEHDDYDEIEAATRLTKELQLFFDGLNEADKNGDGEEQPVLVDIWRASVPPADTISLISGDNPGELGFAAEALRDATRPTGKSQFFRIQRVHAAD